MRIVTSAVLLLMGCGVNLSRGVEIDMALCAKREAHWTFKGTKYYYSGFTNDLDDEPKSLLQPDGVKDSNYTGVIRDFGEAVKHCSLRCMALVSLETEEEWDFIREKMEEVNTPFIWTSGHKCDKTVSKECFTTPSIQPRIVNSWFWSGSGARIPPTNSTPEGWTKNPWGSTGIFTKVNQQTDPSAPPVPQPDNAEEELNLLKSQEESCLALATDLWEPGTVWNDIACYHEKAWICEDSPDLLAQAGISL
ncbi:uncharacterized protein LOC111718310 [Eurytemora carolleeae]|uniref:uncharacterized protein LOC111718310 n=1 Tax=Eurytemora carolleeae TaxID=1294199 RepID=UPI000C75BF30|nr:uncharacterized protein LOC111718310 [Eurytemora carolleeae]|eukprot:XP_023349634.1 uncharacterized protein LOC111718310 [Eurytemora affinis]